MATPRRYAEGTSVSVEKSEAEMRQLLRRYGADGFATGEQGGQVAVQFQMNGRRIVFRMRVPDRAEKRFHLTPHHRHARSPEAAYAAWEQACRQKWRALVLCIKAKMESVEAGIETFDDAFLAHIMLPTGETVGQWAQHPENLQGALEGRPMPPLLPGPVDPQ